MSDVAIVYATFASVEEAEGVARAVIEERLAACANVMAACTSIYRWKDGVETEIETPVVFKTSTALAIALRDRIETLHSYDTPAIELWPAATTPEAAQWIDDSTGGQE